MNRLATYLFTLQRGTPKVEREIEREIDLAYSALLTGKKTVATKHLDRIEGLATQYGLRQQLQQQGGMRKARGFVEKAKGKLRNSRNSSTSTSASSSRSSDSSPRKSSPASIATKRRGSDFYQVPVGSQRGNPFSKEEEWVGRFYRNLNANEAADY